MLPAIIAFGFDVAGAVLSFEGNASAQMNLAGRSVPSRSWIASGLLLRLNLWLDTARASGEGQRRADNQDGDQNSCGIVVPVHV